MRNFIFFIFLGILGISVPAYSQREKAETYKILGVSVEGNNSTSGRNKSGKC